MGGKSAGHVPFSVKGLFTCSLVHISSVWIKMLLENEREGGGCGGVRVVIAVEWGCWRAGRLPLSPVPASSHTRLLPSMVRFGAADEAQHECRTTGRAPDIAGHLAGKPPHSATVIFAYD